jgi:Rieske Fe-S protein
MADITSRRIFLMATGGMLACGGSGNIDDDFDIPPKEPAARPAEPGPEGPSCPDSVDPNTKWPLAKDIALHQAVRVENTSYWICRGPDGLFAIENRCTHAGCATNLLRESLTWKCPCHGSEFAYDGALLFGPAQRAMRRFAVCKLPDGRAVVDTRKPL